MGASGDGAVPPCLQSPREAVLRFKELSYALAANERGFSCSVTGAASLPLLGLECSPEAAFCFPFLLLICSSRCLQ